MEIIFAIIFGVLSALGVSTYIKLITLKHFPQAEILFIETNLKYYDKQDGIFNKFQATDLTALHNEAKLHIR